MQRYNPSRLLRGDDIGTLVDKARIAPRLGNRALLVIDPDLERTGDGLRHRLAEAGIQGILFNRVAENATSDIVEDALSLAASARAQYVVGIGSPVTLSYAKTIAFAAGYAGTRKTVFDLIDSAGLPARGDTTGTPRPGVRNPFMEQIPVERLPFIAIPSRCWNPLIFTDFAVVTDSRNRLSRIIETGVYPDSVLALNSLVDGCTEKQVVYDMLCVLSSCIEGGHDASADASADAGADAAIAAPLFHSALSGVIGSIRGLPMDEHIDRYAVHTFGIQASFAAVSLGVGTALGWAIHGSADIPVQWACASLLPRTTTHRIGEKPSVGPYLAEYLEVESPELIDEEMRSLVAMADIPLRLRDLGLIAGHTEAVSRSASDICGTPYARLAEIVEDSF